MLNILLLIFKILGIVFLSVLGFLLLMLFLVLFLPIRYKIRAKKENDIWGKARVKWLFGILYVKCDYKEEKFTYSVRICGKLILSDQPKNKKPKKKKKKNNKKLTKKKPSKKQPIAKSIEKKENLLESKPLIKDVIEEEKDEFIEKDFEDFEQVDTVRESKAKKNKFFSILSKVVSIPKRLLKILIKIKEKILSLVSLVRGVLRKIGMIKAFIKEAANKPGFSKVWMYVKRILHHIKPKKIKCNLKFGTGDPCTTGQLLGVIYAVYPAATNKFTIQPDFDEKRFEGELYARGRIRMFTLLVIAIKVLRDQDIKILRKNLTKLKEEL